jgi:hypothetical protein
MNISDAIKKSGLEIKLVRSGVWQFTKSGIWLEINKEENKIYFSVHGKIEIDNKELNIDTRDSDFTEENLRYYVDLIKQYLNIFNSNRLYIAKVKTKILFWHSFDSIVCVKSPNGKFQKLNFDEDGRIKLVDYIDALNAVPILPARLSVS